MALQDTPDPSDSNLVQYPYRRGATVIGADGNTLGTLEQIVIDRETGVLRGLIIRTPPDGAEFELPEERVTRNEGDALHLNITHADLATDPTLARPYNPEEYVPVERGQANDSEEASRVALETGHPVIQTVGENSAQVVGPEVTPEAAPTDEGVGAVSAMAAASASTQPTDTAVRTDGGETVREPGAPAEAAGSASDIVAGGAGLADSSTIAEPAVAGTPPQTASRTESTTGDLIGGKPSTGGYGEASVAPVHSLPYDTVPTPPHHPPNTPEARETGRTNEPIAQQPLDAGMRQAFSEAGSRPNFSSPGENVSGNIAVVPEKYPSTPTMESADAEQLNLGGSPAAESPARMEPPLAAMGTPAAAPAPSSMPRIPVERQLPAPSALSQAQAWLTRLPKWATPSALATLGAVSAGVVAGVVMRRRQRPSARAKRVAKQAKAQLQDTLQGTGEHLRESAQGARAGARRQVKRVARRGRWFRRGMLLGGGLAILFAPERGSTLRTQLADRVERFRARSA